MGTSRPGWPTDTVAVHSKVVWQNVYLFTQRLFSGTVVPTSIPGNPFPATLRSRALVLVHRVSANLQSEPPTHRLGGLVVAVGGRLHGGIRDARASEVPAGLPYRCYRVDQKRRGHR